MSKQETREKQKTLAKAMVKQGHSVKEACAKVGMPIWAFYDKRGKKVKKSTTPTLLEVPVLEELDNPPTRLFCLFGDVRPMVEAIKELWV